MKTRLPISLVLAFGAAACVSCGSDDGGSGPSDTTPPTITSVSPADGEDDVGLIERVEITFSEPMDASTINDQTITVAGRSRGGFVGYDADTRTATLVPDTLYSAEAEHTVTVTTGVTDEAGNALAAPSATTFDTGVLDCEHLVDYLEPNDDAANAAAVEMDRVYHTLSVCGDDMDFFRFDLTETTRIDFHISFRQSVSQRSSLVLMRENTTEPFFTRAWPATVAGEERTVSFTFLPGTYRYRYSATNEADEFVLYDFELETGEPCGDDAFEDNDWYNGAAPITEGTYEDLSSCPGDGDYFAIELEAGQTLTVTVTAVGDPVERQMEIWSPGAEALVSFSSSDATEILEATAEETGTYRVHLRAWSGSGEYEMDVDVSE